MANRLMLSEVTDAALQLAARRSAGGILTTGLVLASLAEFDAANDWERLWLHCGEPRQIGLAEAPDEPGCPGDSRDSPPQVWKGALLSSRMASAFVLLAAICDAYDLAPAAPGALALAITADPACGATLALTRAGLSHERLLDIVQADLLGTHLTDFTSFLVRERARPGRSAAPGIEGAAGPETVSDYLALARARSAGRQADELDLIAVLALAPASGKVLERLGLHSELLGACENSLRAIGVSDLAEVAASVESAGGHDPAGTVPLRLLAALAVSRSNGLSWLLRLTGMDRTDVAAEAMEEVAVRRGQRREVGAIVIAMGIATLILSLTVTILICVDTFGPGSLWELLLIPCAWLGSPRWPGYLSVAAAAPVTLAVNPVAGAVQLANGVTDMLLASAERRALMGRTGVPLSWAAARRVKLRRLKKGRLSLAFRQIARFKILAPRLEAAAAKSRSRGIAA